MRRTTTLLALAVLVLLGVVVAPAASADPASDPAVQARTDALAFPAPLAEFSRQRAAATPGDGLDWSTDLCSVPLLREPQRSMPQGFDFRAACERHDFGYRNLKAQGRFDEAVRRRLDDGFLADMDAVCAADRGWFGVRAATCRRIAGDYHFWVRSCGANPAPYCPLEVRDAYQRYVPHRSDRASGPGGAHSQATPSPSRSSLPL